ncbi:hypothetical protein R3X25_11680 [Lutibacter sp. TH_r2]|uniref:hypothetical protein n=1 Tax=Lutibacter sp. TH_r2 TaxID=3082083 RepID=UPI0029529DC0|nr:hypothetical protein [Lutibacter sp. TH_r2]MDV7187943.1 hypothetical protein [Lutibacter sp. TH_r2]
MSYDTINFQYQIKKLPYHFKVLKNEPYLWRGLSWQPVINNQGYLSYYYTYINNLKLVLKYDKIYLKNSLQKFYMNNNYQSFSYSQVVKAFERLNKLLPFNVYEAIVTKVAIGIVFEENAEKTYGEWLYYQGKSPMQMQDKNKVYGAKFHLTDYYIKGYNKTFQVKSKDNFSLNKPYFRYEIEAKTKFFNNKTNNIGIENVADLINEEKYNKLCNMLIDRYKMIQTTTIIDYSECNLKEKKLIAYMENPIIKKSVQNQHTESFKKDRITYNKLVKVKSNNNFQNIILNKITNQVNYSLKN